MKKRIGVVGATGYAGAEVVRLLTGHPGAELTQLVSKTYAGTKISEVYQNLRGLCDLELTELDADALAANCDLVFTALPHGTAQDVIPGLIERGLKVIDLSADYRYRNPDTYEAWYNIQHKSKGLLAESVYGLCELYREEIKKARLVGNPGCYTTCSILGAYPMLKGGFGDSRHIVIDAKSGVSGAGRNTKLDYQFCECTENMKAYGIGTHRHTSEIEEQLSFAAGEEVRLSFTPHLIPQKRGILSTIYIDLKQDTSAEELVSYYRDFYQGEPFLRVYDAGKLPETNHVAGSNFVDIGIVVDKRLSRAVVVSCIDNLVKGAAGQAVQNMNLVLGLPETQGLTAAPIYL